VVSVYRKASSGSKLLHSLLSRTVNPFDGGFASEYSVREADEIMANQSVSVVSD